MLAIQNLLPSCLTVPPEKKASKKWCQMSQSVGEYNSLVFRQCQLAPSTYNIPIQMSVFYNFKMIFLFYFSIMDELIHVPRYYQVCLLLLVAQSCPTLYDPMDCSPPGSSVHGILQSRYWKWVITSFSRGPSCSLFMQSFGFSFNSECMLIKCLAFYDHIYQLGTISRILHSLFYLIP